jgi:hypothetical protein
LNEATEELGAELAAQWEVDAELEALWTSATRVWDLVLDNIDGPSSLAASLSTVVELLEGWIDTAATNGVRWGTRSALVAALSRFLELNSKLVLLRSRHNADLIDYLVDSLWTRVRIASDLLASHVPSSVARNPSDGVGK